VIPTLINKSIDFKTLLFPRKTNLSIPHGKIQWMLVCISLNATFVQSLPFTNLWQHAQCPHWCFLP
jgi:hypothetical protein